MYIIVITIALVGIGLVFYAHRNLTYDHDTQAKLQQAGFQEKQAKLPDGSVLNYGEGPANGPALVLLHGQQVSWEDYAPVLPELAKRYHVYAIDYYGHGGSSKNPAKYSATAISTDISWFIRQYIKQPVIISGHSSGGLLASLITADAPDVVRGLVIEDAPFFTTEKAVPNQLLPGEALKTCTISWQADSRISRSIGSIIHTCRLCLIPKIQTLGIKSSRNQLFNI